MTGFRRILVPHDFSDHAAGALRTAVGLCAPGGRVLVLHVVVPFTPVADIPPAGIASYISPDELLSGAKRQLARLVAKAVPRGRRIRVDPKVEIGDPYQRIIQAARGMDLIIMSTAGRTGLSHLLIGSVAEKVVRHSPGPVLTLRPGVGRKSARRGRRS
jgi:nucleotide-binding universal stress UspA family protein